MSWRYKEGAFSDELWWKSLFTVHATQSFSNGKPLRQTVAQEATVCMQATYRTLLTILVTLMENKIATPRRN